MTSGQQAEGAVAAWLEGRGFKIIRRNWRTQLCEVDLIALSPDKVLCFVEVKYRSSELFGDGFAYVGPKKMDKLKLAVRLWQAAEGNEDKVDILVAAVSGAHFEKIDIRPTGISNWSGLTV